MLNENIHLAYFKHQNVGPFCNDRPFYVVVLEGYGVAGIYIVVLGHSDRMFGCLGNLVMCLPPRR